MQASLSPLVVFDAVPLGTANALLVEWGHRMGPLRRPMNGDAAYALTVAGEPVAVVTHSCCMAERVAGVSWLTREDSIELSRLCASGTQWCRVALRLWREAVFPRLCRRWAVSYQDAALHRGEVYRCDGWARVAYSHSGTDRRSGRPGRNKWVWVWPRREAEEEMRRMAA